MTKEELVKKVKSPIAKIAGDAWPFMLILILINAGAIIVIQMSGFNEHIADEDVHIDFADQELFSESSKPNPANTERLQELEIQNARQQQRIVDLEGDLLALESRLNRNIDRLDQDIRDIHTQSALPIPIEVVTPP